MDSSSEEESSECDISSDQKQLYNFCSYGIVGNVKILLDNGCNPNFFINDEAPIHIATKSNYFLILAVLLLNNFENHKVKTDSYVADGKFFYNPLKWAVSCGYLESVAILSYLNPNLILHTHNHEISAFNMACSLLNKNSNLNMFVTSKYSQIISIFLRHIGNLNLEPIDNVSYSTSNKNRRSLQCFNLMAIFKVFLGKNGLLQNLFPFIIFTFSFLISCTYAIDFYQRINIISNTNLYVLNIFSHFYILIVLTLLYSSNPGIVSSKPSYPTAISYKNKEIKYNYDDDTYYRALRSIIEEKDRKNSISYKDENICHVCCQVYPDGSKVNHCKQIGACISGYDHYCIFLQKPIGDANFIYFFMFLFTMGFISMPLSLYIYFLNLNFFNGRPQTMSFLFIFSIWVLIIWLYVLLLCFFHCYLIYKGVTTREYLAAGKKINISCHENSTEFHSVYSNSTKISSKSE